MSIRKLLASGLSAILLIEPALVHADEHVLEPSPQALRLLDKSLSSKANGAEYVFQPYPGAVLMPINLWGSVLRAGIYRVPLKTDLVTLLSLAGGPTENAEIDEIVIRRSTSNSQVVMKVDAKRLLKEEGVAVPTLESGDVVYIPKNEPWITQNTVITLSVVSTIVSIIVSGIVISKAFKN